jgi:DNA polymerase III alpha subunit
VSIQIIKNTEFLLKNAILNLNLNASKQKNSIQSKEGDRLLLENLAKSGLVKRYGNTNKAQARVIKELKVINDLNFSGYFLITWDIIQYSKVKVLCM